MSNQNRNHRKAGKSLRAAVVMAMAVIVSGTTLFVRPATAENLWMERTKVVAELGGKYAEAPTALGVSSNGGVLELFTAEDGATWTMVITMPNGLSTVVANGEHWIPVKRIKGRES